MKLGTFLCILALIFITLKLCAVITWSWLWVMAPLWIPFALFFSIGLLVVIVALCLGFASKR